MPMVSSVEVTPQDLEVALLKWFTDSTTGQIPSHQDLVATGYSARQALTIQADALFNYLSED